MTGRRSLSDIEQIWNCENAFVEPCPKQWELLDETPDKRVRFCGECEQTVTLCHTPEQFVELGNAGQCVACPTEHAPGRMRTMVLGRPSEETIDKLEAADRRTADWWAEAEATSPEFSQARFKMMKDETANPSRRISRAESDRFDRLMRELRLDPEPVYLFLRTRASGKREKKQNIFKSLQRYSKISFNEFSQLAERLDREHPPENDLTGDAKPTWSEFLRMTFPHLNPGGQG